MAWNQPLKNKPIEPKKSGMWQRGLLAGALVVALCCIVVWMMRPSSEGETRDSLEKNHKIKEMAPVKPKTKKVETVEQATEPVQVAEAVEQPPTTNAAPRKLKLWEKGIRVPKTKPAPPKRFKYDAEEDIAFFLETEPGETIFGEIPFDHRFIEQLKESFKEPVEIKPDDSEEMVELKKAIQETKEDLQKRMAAGEDIAQLFTDSRHRLMELGSYRRDVINDMMEMAMSEDTSGEDFDVYVQSVNTMLEKKGCKPFTPTPMTYKMLELSAKKRNRNK